MTAGRELPAYSGKDAYCRMCGDADVSVNYHLLQRFQALRQAGPRGEPWPCEFVSGIRKHMCRVCATCGYGWCEATLEGSPGATVIQMRATSAPDELQCRPSLLPMRLRLPHRTLTRAASRTRSPSPPPITTTGQARENCALTASAGGGIIAAIFRTAPATRASGCSFAP